MRTDSCSAPSRAVAAGGSAGGSVGGRRGARSAATPAAAAEARISERTPAVRTMAEPFWPMECGAGSVQRACAQPDLQVPGEELRDAPFRPEPGQKRASDESQMAPARG